MLKQGPIPRFVHGFLEYAAAVLFFAAPFLFGFDAGAAVAASIIAGVVVLFLAASTEGPSSLINYVPLAAHVVLDYVLAILLIAIPFIAGFSDETGPTVFFIAIGALYMLVAIGTRFKKDENAPSRKERKRGRREASKRGPAEQDQGLDASGDEVAANTRRERSADDWLTPTPEESRREQGPPTSR
ncbi:MAG TPA: hypothetical protein VI111_01855 [Thermoleophilaceae bacterium]